VQVLSWFQNCGTEAHTPNLTLCRIKNKFSFDRSQVVGGYRDLMCGVIFEHTNGLKVICEIQIHDKVLFDLKSKVSAFQDAFFFIHFLFYVQVILCMYNCLINYVLDAIVFSLTVLLLSLQDFLVLFHYALLVTSDGCKNLRLLQASCFFCL
jgi:hypothetical protein